MTLKSTVNDVNYNVIWDVHEYPRGKHANVIEKEETNFSRGNYSNVVSHLKTCHNKQKISEPIDPHSPLMEFYYNMKKAKKFQGKLSDLHDAARAKIIPIANKDWGLFEWIFMMDNERWS